MCREAVKIHQAKAAVKSSRIFLTRIFLGVLCNVPWIDVLLAHSGSRTLRAFLSCLWFISRDLLDLSYSEKAAQMVPALQFPILHAGRYSPPAACSEHLPLPVLEDDMPSLHEFDFFFFFYRRVAPALGLKWNLEIIPWENDMYWHFTMLFISPQSLSFKIILFFKNEASQNHWLSIQEIHSFYT